MSAREEDIYASMLVPNEKFASLFLRRPIYINCYRCVEAELEL